MTTTNRPKPTDRELAKGAFTGSIILAVLASAFGTCGAVQIYRETAVPRDVAVADLSDVNKVPTGLRVRVEAKFRPETRATTRRHKVMIALDGVPDVVVTCTTDEPTCAEQGPAVRTLIGRVEAHDDTAVPIAIAQYAPKVLHLDAAKVRALDVNGGEAGFRGGYIAAFSIAGFCTLCLMAGLARAMFMLRRARRSEA